MSFTEQPLTTFFLLLCGHAIADFALQNEWVSTNKNRHVRLRYSPDERAKMQVVWPYLMSAHALHHGLLVFLVTQKLSLAFAETVIHWISDYAKCENWITFHQDQAVHIFSKLIWTILVFI